MEKRTIPMATLRPLCNWCSQNDFSEGCEDCDHPDFQRYLDLHNKFVDFHWAPEPRWPGNVIKWSNVLDNHVKKNAPFLAYDEIDEIKADRYFAMTTEEIAAKLGISDRSVKRIIARALDKLKGHLKAEDMLYYGERTNFFNPNHGGERWQLIRSLLQG